MALVVESVTLVEELEIGDDNWNRQRYCEYPDQSTHRPNDFAWQRDGILISITYRCHGDEAVPECIGNADELLVHSLFAIKNGAREHDDSKDEKEDEHAQLADTRF